MITLFQSIHVRLVESILIPQHHISFPGFDFPAPTTIPLPYLGSLPDDVLDLVGFVSELLEAQRLHAGRERLILKQVLPLKALLPQDAEVLAVEAEGLVQRPFPVSPLSFPDQPVTEKARRCIGHLVSASFL